MKFSHHIFEDIKDEIERDNLVSRARKFEKDFTRTRKLSVNDVILYILNRRGLTNKMEIADFIREANLPEVSDVALLRQREKLNPDVFKYLNDKAMKSFYNDFLPDVKLLKGYVLTAIDGSDWEVPNLPSTRREVKASKNASARVKVSSCFDLLNCFVLDSCVERNKFCEKELAKLHLLKAKELVGDLPIIRVMDRGYLALSDIFQSTQNNDKFVVRIKSQDFKAEREKLTSNDEWMEINYQYDRIAYYKKRDPELFDFYTKGNTLKVRVIHTILDSGEEEILFTNLSEKEFNTNEILTIYQLRWGIETNYHYLKESMKMTNISSGKIELIKQDIFSQFFVFNILQAIQNEVEEEIDQSKYKHHMKVNINMAVGFIKRYFMMILTAENKWRQEELYEALHNNVLKNLVPVRPGRRFERNKNRKNRYHINKRKSF